MGFFRLGEPDIQHAVFKVGIHFFTLDRRGQPDGPLKRSVVAFAAVVVLFFYFIFAFFFAPDGEDVAGYIQIDILGFEPRQFRADGNFTVMEVECLAGCGFPTTVQINSQYFENVTAKDVPDILERLKSQGS